MDNRNKGMPRLVSTFNKFEDTVESICSKVDDFIQQPEDGLEHVVNTLETVGDYVTQVCSYFAQGIFPECHIGSMEDAACESSLAQDTDEVNELSNEGIHEEKLENGSWNLMPLQHLLPQGPENFAHPCIYVQDITDANHSIKENQVQPEMSDTVILDKRTSNLSASSPTSRHLYGSSSCVENQLQLEMSDSVVSDKEDPKISVLSPTPKDIQESGSLGFRPSFSVSSFQSIESEVLDVDDISGTARAELIGKSDNTIDDTITNRGSSYEIKFDEGCILVDSSELSDVCHETETPSSCKEKLQASSEEKEDGEEHAACLDSESCEGEGEGEGPLSSSLMRSNDGSCKSDWVII